ncbi:hypothetical protein DdX_06960 [Ditylenchus destructor]|uniref:Uncharacterized protein n=1 Tax=Ditylenchus destructor TaxID=166010 RepID=A0AAD4R5D2_9BILA|nr:hypothetical protein DdX_06960 [Ditylenchus destructor]
MLNSLLAKLVFVIFILTISYQIWQVNAASCTSEEYCPGGWSVKRREADYSAQTCDPMGKTKKCPKPYMCVASQCGINFCCASDKMLAKIVETQHSEEEKSEEGDL